MLGIAGVLGNILNVDRNVETIKELPLKEIAEDRMALYKKTVDAFVEGFSDGKSGEKSSGLSHKKTK